MIKDDFLTLTAQKFINTYFTSRNFDQVKNMFAPEGSWLGASNNTMANNLKQFDQYFKEGCNEGYVPEITFQDCYVIYNDDNIGIVYCNYHLHIESKGALFDMDQRVTIVLKQFILHLKLFMFMPRPPMMQLVKKNSIPMKLLNSDIKSYNKL